MSRDHAFISHSSKDDDFVKELRLALESHKIVVWVDSRELIGGNKLAPDINEAIEHARQFVVVLSPNSIDSLWVRKEIDKALEVERRRKDHGYRVIALLLPGIEPSDLAKWFDEEPVGLKIELRAGGLSEALPHILASLGERLPDDHQPTQEPDARRVAELKLKLKSARTLDDLGNPSQSGTDHRQRAGCGKGSRAGHRQLPGLPLRGRRDPVRRGTTLRPDPSGHSDGRSDRSGTDPR